MKLRAARPLSAIASALLLGLVLSTSTGCGMLSAMGNPKVAWALQDPAPMTVVVRRADAADATVQQVNRLLTATPTGSWLGRVSPDPDAVADEMKLVGADPIYAESHARVVAAEVWSRTLPRLKATKGDRPSLLGAIGPDLAASYADIIGKKAEIAGIGALIEDEKTAMTAKDIDESDKAQHQSTITKLEKMKADSEAEVEPLSKAFLASARDAAAAAPADEKERLAPAIAAMLKALDDADIANSAAAIRFPLALPSMLTSVKAAVPNIVADIIEEKTGKRPSFTKLDAEVTLNGTDVSVAINGLGPSELGSLKMEDLTKETISRTGKWVLHATGLLAKVGATKDALAFQSDALSRIQAGLTGAAAPSGDSPSVMIAVAAPSADVSVGVGSVGGGLAGKKIGGLANAKVGASVGAGLAMTGGAKLSSASVSAPSGVNVGVSGLTASAKLPGASGLTASAKIPGVSGLSASAKLPGVSGLSASAKLPGVPGAGASASAGGVSANVKLPGAAGSVLGGRGAAAARAKDPQAAAAGLAKDAAPSAAAKSRGGGAALGALGAASALAKDPKAAAGDLAKEGASAALKKVGLPSSVKIGFGK